MIAALFVLAAVGLVLGQIIHADHVEHEAECAGDSPGASVEWLAELRGERS